MDAKLEKTIEIISRKFDPVSIFLYGSRARSDFLEQSDYEIGVIYRRSKKISRSELGELNPYKDVILYPFEYEDFIDYKIDTPFPENIYFRELIVAGKTLYGKEIIENLEPPKITTVDLLQRINFDIGFALAAILSNRNGDKVTAASEFTKSCFFGVRCLIILENGEFPTTYNNIYEESQKINLNGYQEVVDHALDVRRGGEINEKFLYQNISLLNQIVRYRISSSLKEKGNKNII